RVYEGYRTRATVSDLRSVDGRVGIGGTARRLLPERSPAREAGHGHPDDFKVPDRRQGAGGGRDGEVEKRGCQGTWLTPICGFRTRCRPPQSSAPAGRE